MRLHVTRPAAAAVITAVATAAVVGGISQAAPPPHRSPTAPSALALQYASNVSKGAAVIGTLDGWTWEGLCTVSGSKVSTFLRGVPPSGTSYALEYDEDTTVSTSGTGDEGTPTTSRYVGALPGLTAYKDVLSTETDGSEHRVYTRPLQYVGSNGHIQTLAVRITANGHASVPAHEARCMIEGSVVAGS